MLKIPAATPAVPVPWPLKPMGETLLSLFAKSQPCTSSTKPLRSSSSAFVSLPPPVSPGFVKMRRPGCEVSTPSSMIAMTMELLPVVLSHALVARASAPAVARFSPRLFSACCVPKSGFGGAKQCLISRRKFGCAQSTPFVCASVRATSRGSPVFGFASRRRQAFTFSFPARATTCRPAPPASVRNCAGVVSAGNAARISSVVIMRVRDFGSMSTGRA